MSFSNISPSSSDGSKYLEQIEKAAGQFTISENFIHFKHLIENDRQYEEDFIKRFSLLKTEPSISISSSSEITLTRKRPLPEHRDLNPSRLSKIKMAALVFCDKELIDSKLEGANFAEVLHNFLFYFHQIQEIQSHPVYDELIVTLAKTCDLAINHPNTEQEEIIKYMHSYCSILASSLSDELEETNEIKCIKTFLKDPEFVDSIAQQFIKTCEHELFAQNILSYHYQMIHLIKSEIKEMRLDDPKISNKEVIKQFDEFESTVRTSSQAIVCMLLGNEILDAIKEKALEIKLKLKELEIGKEFLCLGGYFSIPHSHAMLYVFKKTNETTFDFTVINTGFGSDYHTNYSYKNKNYIVPLYEFKNIPSDYLLGSGDDSDFEFMIELIKFKTQHLYLIVENYSDKSMCIALYEFLFSYLHNFRIINTYSDYDLIRPQTSGTCTVRSLKAYISSRMKDKTLYKNWILLFKRCLLIDTFQELKTLPITHPSFETSLAITTKSAQNLINKLHKDLKQYELNDAESTLATAIEIYRQCIEMKGKTFRYTLQKAKERFFTGPIHINPVSKISGNLKALSHIDFQDCPNFITSSPQSVQKCLEPISRLTYLESSIPEDVRTINKYDFKGQNFTYDYFFDYILNLPFPNEWSSTKIDYEATIKALYSVVNNIRHQNDTKTFACIWKAYLIILHCAREQHPFLKEFKVHSFGIDKQNFIDRYVNNDFTIHDLIKKCLEQIEKFNSDFKLDDTPVLFESLTNFSIPIDANQNLASPDGSIFIYQHLCQLNSKLNAKIQATLDNYKYSKLLVLEPLVLDFDVKNGILAEHGFSTITILKKVALWTEEKKMGFNALLDQKNLTNALFKINSESYLILDIPTKRLNYYLSMSEVVNIVKFDRILAAIISKELSVNKTHLTWSQVPKNLIESFLINHQEEILAAFKGSELENSFIFELILANANNSDPFINSLQVFANPKYFSLLIDFPEYLHLFEYLFFGASLKNPIGENFVIRLQTDEIARSIAEDFFENWISNVGRWINKTDQIRSLLKMMELIFNVKFQVELFAPFLPDLKALIHESLSNKQIIDSLIYRYDLIFRHDKTSIDYLISSLIAHIQSNPFIRITSYELQKLMLFHIDSMHHPKILQSIKPYILDFFQRELIKYPTFTTRIDPSSMLFWIDIDDHTGFGFSLFDRCRYSKIKGIIRPIENGNDLRDIQESNFIQALFEKYPWSQKINHMGARYYLTPFGQIVSDDSSETIFAKFSDQTNHGIPKDLHCANWALITELVTDRYITNQSDHCDLNCKIPSANVHNNLIALSSLPYEIADICQIFYTQISNRSYFLTTNSQFRPNFLIQLDCSTYEITDLQDYSKIRFLESDHPLVKLFPNHVFLCQFVAENSKITCINKNSEKLILIEKKGVLYIENAPDFILTDSIPDILLPYAQGMVFQNDKGSKIIFLATLFYTNINFQCPDKIGSLRDTEILTYRFENGKLSCKSLKGKFYFVYLQIINHSKLIYEEIDQLIAEIHISTSPKDFIFIENALKFLSKNYQSYGIAQASILTFIVKITLNLNMVDFKTPIGNQEFRSILKDYFKIFNKLPQIARLTSKEFEVINKIQYPIDNCLIKIANSINKLETEKETSTIFSSTESTTDLSKVSITPSHTKRNFLKTSFHTLPLRKNVEHADDHDPSFSILTFQEILQQTIHSAISYDPLKEKLPISTVVSCYASFSNQLNHSDLAIFLLNIKRSHVTKYNLQNKTYFEILELIFSKEFITYFEDKYDSLFSNIPHPVPLLYSTPKSTKKVFSLSVTFKKNLHIICSEYDHELALSYKELAKYKKNCSVTFLSQKIQKLIDLLKPCFLSRSSSPIIGRASPEELSSYACVRSLLKPNHDRSDLHFDNQVDIHRLTDFELSVQILIENFQKVALIKEKNFFDLLEAPTFDFKGKIEEEILIALSKKYSNQTTSHTIDGLIHCILEDHPQGLQFFFDQCPPLESKNDLSRFEVLQHLLMEILILRIESYKMKRALSLYSSYSHQSSVDELKTLIFAERNYSYEKRHLILFEYLSQFAIRPVQMDVFNKMSELKDGQYLSQVSQVIMGGGKTSVITTLLAAQKSTPSSINLFLTPDSQIENVFSLLYQNLFRFFRYDTFHLKITRGEMTEERLSMILHQIEQAKVSQLLIVSTPEIIQGLELEYLDEMRLGHFNKKFDILSRIIFSLRNHCDCIVDEFSYIADVKKITNYPIIKSEELSKKIPLEHIKLYEALFIFLTSDKYKIESRSVADITRIHLNEQMFIKEEEWQELIPHLANEASICISKLYPNFIDPSSLTSLLKSREISSEVQQIWNRDSKKPEIQLIALAHYTIHSLLKRLFKKHGGRDFGRDPHSTKVIPYHGVGSPSTAEFGFLYETLTFHFCQAAQVGIDLNQLLFLQKMLIKKASSKIYGKSLSIDQTKEGVRFKELTGLSLSTNPKDIEQFNIAVKNINNNKSTFNFKILFEIEKLTCEETITSHPHYLSSNPHNLFFQFKTVRGLTGTPWNHLTYNQIFQNNIHLDLEIEEKIKETFCSKPNINGLTSFQLETSISKPDLFLKSIFEKLLPSEQVKVQAIIDTGGIFKEYNNEQVAELLFSYLRNIYPEKNRLSVIYFGKDQKKYSWNLPSALFLNEFKQIQKIPLASLSHQGLIEAGIQTDDFFIYYDEAHTIGTDVKLKADAIGLITIDEKTVLHQFTQGLLRLRDYFHLQNCITIIPDIVQNSRTKRIETREDLLTVLENNQKEQISSLMHLSLKQQITNILRDFAIQLLIEDKGQNYHHFQAFIESEENFNIVEFATSESGSSPIDQIVEFGKSHLSQFIESLKNSNISGIKDKIEEIDLLLTGRIQKLLEFAFNHQDYFETHPVFEESEITIEQQKLVQQTKENLTHKECIAGNKILSIPITYETPLNFSEIISHFSESDTFFKKENQILGPLSMILSSTLERADYPYSWVFQTLNFSKNCLSHYSGILESAISPKRKKIRSCLIILNKKQQDMLTSIGLTHFETDLAIQYLSTYPQKNCFLLNANRQLIVNNLNALELEKPLFFSRIQMALLEVLIFNQDIESLNLMFLTAHKWFNTHLNFDIPSSTPASYSLDKLRSEYIKIGINQQKRWDLMPFVEGLAQGEFIDYEEKREKEAETSIKTARLLLANNQIKEVKQILEEIPRKYCYFIPTELVPFLPDGKFKSLSDRKLVQVVPKNKWPFLKSYQSQPFNYNQLLDPISLEVVKKTAALPASLTLIYNYQNIPGLPNLGNTCFINSALKALFAFPDLKSLIINAPLKYGDPSEENLKEGLLALYEAYLNKSASLHKQLITLLNNPLLSVLDPFEKQGDPDEVLKILFRALGLNDHLSMSIGIKGHLTPIIPLNFIDEGQKSTPFKALIDQALADEYGLIHPDYSQLKTIGIQLPRFTLDSSQRPIRNNQLFGGLLEPAIITLKDEENFIELKLTARSLICHSGNLHSGHYRTFEKRDDQWILHDDATVSIVKKEQLLKISIEAYLVFFDVEILKASQPLKI